MKPRFITLEGIEGAGKSTVARALLQVLTDRGIPALLTREPGGTPLAEQIRELVLTPHTEALPMTAETLLMFASRAVHVENLIRPSLMQGTWVVCDRFTDASRAYQGSGRGVPEAFLTQLTAAVQGTLVPDCTVLLDLPVEVGLARARERKGSAAADRFESLGEAFFERVRQGYLQLAQQEPARFRIVNAAAPLPQVLAQVEQIVLSLT